MDNYYDILNIKPDATKSDVVESYNRLKKIFSEDSMAVYGLFSPEMLAEKTQELELAYQVLSDTSKRETYDEELKEKKIEPLTATRGTIEFKTVKRPEEETSGKTKKEEKKEKPPVFEVTKSAKIEQKESDIAGMPDVQNLPALRKKKDISLSEIHEETKIKINVLESIEALDFESLPARPYLRGFLVSYAEFLDIDTGSILEEYMRLYDEWRDNR